MCVVVSCILDARLHLPVNVGAPSGVTQEEWLLYTGVFFLSFVFSSLPSFCGARLLFLIATGVQRSLSLVDREVDCRIPTT